MTVNILGIEYEIIHGMIKDYPALKSRDGYCDDTVKQIVIQHPDEWDADNPNAKGDLPRYFKQVLRHEIIHAFLSESGLSDCSLKAGSWATNEEMVDWFAIQFLKLQKAFKEAEAI